MPRTEALKRAQAAHEQRRRERAVKLRLLPDEIDKLDALRRDGETRQAAIRRLIAHAKAQKAREK